MWASLSRLGDSLSIPDLLRFEKPRQGQDRMIKDIRFAVSQAKSIILNAPTGMGKTDASLAASIPVAMEQSVQYMEKPKELKLQPEFSDSHCHPDIFKDPGKMQT